jgi:hypothetical protein
MFERFTDRARRVIVLAQEEARLLNEGAARPQRSKIACLPAFVLVGDLNSCSLRSRERRFESCWGRLLVGYRQNCRCRTDRTA